MKNLSKLHYIYKRLFILPAVYVSWLAIVNILYSNLNIKSGRASQKAPQALPAEDGDTDIPSEMVRAVSENDAEVKKYRIKFFRWRDRLDSQLTSLASPELSEFERADRKCL
ncbi:hypothetical protein EVAR_41842_1 [Eumeta japonica]|uniref:Uncharacterized protein n=1 Tax=Eumeta variegata TaxID=151549 RepID=A0A4C1XB20_EUMVA|nr:hypothetical protein EVAR_41842_1 [Eumeta japonica]